MTGKPKAKLSDWWASRTVRWNAYMGGLSTAVLPIVAIMDEADFATLGLSAKWALVAALAVKAISNIRNVQLRGVTDRPIAGRADDNEESE